MRKSGVISAGVPLTSIREGRYYLKHIELITAAAAITEFSLYDGGESSLGNEKVTNGNFAADSDWVKGAGWTISDGYANMGTGNLTQDTTEVAGEVYKVTYTVATLTVGNITVSIGGSSGTARTANGTYTEYLRAGATTDLTFTPAGGANGKITGVSVKLMASVKTYEAKEPTANTSKHIDLQEPIEFLNGCYGIVTGASAYANLYE
jgi:hypothetical protein